MRKLNTAMRAFLGDRERFADLFNGVFFQGKPVIRSEGLREASEAYTDMTAEPVDRARDFFADYPITLFCVNEQDNFRMFHTELREVFTVMNCRRNKKLLYDTLLRDPACRTLDAEALKVVSVILNAPGLWSRRDKYILKNQTENREEYDMCQAMRELLADAEAAGRKQGISQGISQGLSQGAADKTRTIVSNMLTRGMSDEYICAIAECTPEFINAVRKKI